MRYCCIQTYEPGSIFHELVPAFNYQSVFNEAVFDLTMV